MTPVWRIPLTDIDFGEREIDAVSGVLRSGWLSMGAVTREFEQAFADYIGTSHAVAVTNCTAALQLAYASLGLGSGDEVIVPALTFVATASAAIVLGATPVFADVTSEDDLTISPTDVGRKITARTRAIAVVHYAGYPADMDALNDLARAHGLAVIEDCAHSVGACYGGRRTGALGDVGCFSFFANKNMTTGEGGMITTNREDLAATLRLLRSHGMTSGTLDRHTGQALTYDVLLAGHNVRLDEMRAALGLVQLAKLEGANARRGEVVRWYREALDCFPAIRVPFAALANSSFHLMPVLLPPGTDRAGVMQSMGASGIQTSIHYPPIHHLHFYRTAGLAGTPVPITDAIADRLLTLPLYPAMEPADVAAVVDALLLAVVRHRQ